LRAYVRAHEFASATADDLLDALGEAVGPPVANELRDWLDTGGHPRVLVDGRCEDGALALTLRQEPASRGIAHRWPIPIALRWPGGERREILSDSVLLLRLRSDDEHCPAWVEANAGRLGFYRVRYGRALERALGDAAAKSLAPAERLGLLSDSWSDLGEGVTPISRYLELVEQFGGDSSPVVLGELRRRLAFLDDEVAVGLGRASLERFTKELFTPLQRRLGWSPRPGEDDATRLLRAAVMDLLGSVARVPDVLKQAAERVHRYLGGPSDVDGAMNSVLVRLAALRGGDGLYGEYLRRLRAARSPEEEHR
jgi:hypothetical protein